MRTNLIMHLHCSECGDLLNLKTADEEVAKPITNLREISPEEPTGAECRYADKISVEPCRRCIEKYTRPAKQLTHALNQLQETLE